MDKQSADDYLKWIRDTIEGNVLPLSELKLLFKKHELVLEKIIKDSGDDIDTEKLAEKLNEFGADVQELAESKNIPWHLNEIEGIIEFSEDVNKHLELMSSEEEKAYNFAGWLAFMPYAAVVKTSMDVADNSRLC